METCKECGFTVMVQIQLGTGFCRPSCQALFEQEPWCDECRAFHPSANCEGS